MTATQTSDFSEKFYVRGLKNSCKVVDLLVQKLLNDMTMDWYPLMNSSLHTRQSQDDKSVRFQGDSFVLLRTWKQVISSCKVYSISTMRTSTWEGTEFSNFILIASIHLWNQSIENFMSSSSLGCDFVTSLIFMTERTQQVYFPSSPPFLASILVGLGFSLVCGFLEKDLWKVCLDYKTSKFPQYSKWKRRSNCSVKFLRKTKGIYISASSLMFSNKTKIIWLYLSYCTIYTYKIFSFLLAIENMTVPLCSYQCLDYKTSKLSQYSEWKHSSNCSGKFLRKTEGICKQQVHWSSPIKQIIWLYLGYCIIYIYKIFSFLLAIENTTVPLCSYQCLDYKISKLSQYSEKRSSKCSGRFLRKTEGM